MRLLVQCATNFSEGRNQAKINAIIAPLKDKPGFVVASVESDADYNRSVVTLIGDFGAMYRPLLNYVDAALEHIDMERHQGQHFRMGAIDVIPFVALEDTPLKPLLAAVKVFGEDLGKRMPVYYYAHSTKNALRKRLPDIRRGGYEGLKKRIREPLWGPDEGMAEQLLGRGAVAVGVRDPLIAYNINLTNMDIAAAHAIAKRIRESGGGLPFVQASAVYLEHRQRCQVTVTLLDYRKTPLHTVFETVKRYAPEYGTRVRHSELVGLMPLDALDVSAYYYDQGHLPLSFRDKINIVKENLMIENLEPDKIIERHLAT